MRKLLKILLIILAIPTVVAVVGIIASVVLYLTTDLQEPYISPQRLSQYNTTDSIGCKYYNKGMMQQNEYGLWELKIEGDAVERGDTFGALADSLLYYQESVFVNELYRIIPSRSYINFLRYILVLFNRDLGHNINEEYRTEIAAMAHHCTHEYDFIGTPYQRQLNYHAAHDIGHLMQDYMLVGCSSFAVWDDAASDSTLLVGRNFDFYMGDDFAHNKLITVCAPDSGYKYISVGWAGMIGVLSGMNEAGLTVTINASKGTLPTTTATPISILAREILQYAGNIEEAYKIADSRRTFVSESILIGSASDGKAAIIEKSPDKMALFTTEGNHIISTNHYQSDTFATDSRNQENIATSDSPHRYARIEALIDSLAPVTTQDVADILRDFKGEGGKYIGQCNELSLNQSIAHHAVIFAPKQRTMWVSTAPWQSGAFIAYNLDSIFSDANGTMPLYDNSLTIAADTAFINNHYNDIVTYRRLTKYIREAADDARTVAADTLQRYIDSNPHLYHTHALAGDYYLSQGNVQQAISEWEKALKLAIPRAGERQAIEEKIKKHTPKI